MNTFVGSVLGIDTNGRPVWDYRAPGETVVFSPNDAELHKRLPPALHADALLAHRHGHHILIDHLGASRFTMRVRPNTTGSQTSTVTRHDKPQCKESK